MAFSQLGVHTTWEKRGLLLKRVKAHAQRMGPLFGRPFRISEFQVPQKVPVESPQ
jgi:hypothetical protein